LDLSISTYYLVEGFKGLEEEYIDPYGNITTHLIGQYVYDKITSLPKLERPQQMPIIKTEISGDIILANYQIANVTYPATYKGHAIHPLMGKSLVPLIEGKVDYVYAPNEPLGAEL